MAFSISTIAMRCRRREGGCGTGDKGGGRVSSQMFDVKQIRDPAKVLRTQWQETCSVRVASGQGKARRVPSATALRRVGG